MGLKSEEEIMEMLRLQHSFLWCWKLDIWENRKEIIGKLPNAMLAKDGDQSSRSCEK